jgi:hypothetical protein
MKSVTDTERYQLKHHVFFKEIPGGILFDAGRGSFILQGKSLYPLVGKIVSLMDAGRSLGEIRAVLPAKLGAVFERLIAALQKHHMLLETREAHSGPDYADQFLRFLQDHLPAAECAQAFTGWQQARVLVVGHGYTLKAALHALAQSAVGHISVYLSGTSEAGVPELTDVLERYKHAEAGGYDWLGANSSTWPADCALLVHAADDLDYKLALACDSFAKAHGINATIAGVWRGHGLVAPPTGSGSLPLSACIERLASSAPTVQHGPHSPTSCALIGSVAAHNALQNHFRIRSHDLARHLYLISPWLEVTQHPLIALPDGTNIAPSQPDMQLPESRSLSRYEQIRFACESWFDPLLGPFDAVRGGYVRQLPLFHDVIRVRSAAPDRVAVGWGVDAEEAALRTLARAFRYWAEAMSGGDKMTVAFDYPTWRAAALAGAIVRSQQFSLACQTVEFNPRQLGSARVQLLVKLLTLYHPRPLKVRIHWVPGLPACQVECYSDDLVLASARGVEPLPAIEEAIGEACSRLQMLDDRFQHPPPVARRVNVLRTIESADLWLSGFPPARAERIAQLSIHEELLPSAALPLETHCGLIRLEIPEYG